MLLLNLSPSEAEEAEGPMCRMLGLVFVQLLTRQLWWLLLVGREFRDLSRFDQ